MNKLDLSMAPLFRHFCCHKSDHSSQLAKYAMKTIVREMSFKTLRQYRQIAMKSAAIIAVLVLSLSFCRQRKAANRRDCASVSEVPVGD